jgi:Tol biopolymer transport system component
MPNVDSGVRVALGMAAALALAATAGCGASAAGGGQHRAPGAAAPARPPAAARPPRQVPGELAFVAHGKLYVLGGPARGPRHVALPGIPAAPAWSADRRWLAVSVSNPPPAGQPYPYRQAPARLWLVSAAGTVVRPLTPASWQVDGFAWAPHADELAVAAYLPRAPQASSALAATVTPAGKPRILLAGGWLTGPAWSPDGTRIAAGIGTFAGGHWHGELDVLGAGGGPPAVVTSAAQDVLEPAGWWPDGDGLLYWRDLGGSASLAADGLPLDSVPLGGHPPRTLVRTMLAHGSWLAPSPLGNAFAAVVGGDRVIWSGGKRLVVCSAAGGCSPVAQPAGVVSVDPSWSPDGTRIAFARLSAAGPFGPNGRAGFSADWITRWEATSRLWIAGAGGSGARPLAGAGPGAVDPVWGSDGSLLFVRDDSLWLLPAGASAAQRLTGPLGALGGAASYGTYYGYVPYPQLFAWALAPRPATAARA